MINRSNFFHLVLFVLALFFCSNIYSQEISKRDSVRIVRHNVSFGFGLVTENKQFMDDLFSKGTFGDLFYLSHYNFGDMITTGALNISYTLNFNKHLAIGCYAAYQMDSKSVYENSVKENIGYGHQIFSSITPRFYVFWLNKDVFRIYSAVGTSFGYYWTKYKFGETEFSERMFEWRPQLTLAGIQAGRRFYGFGEANVGGRLGYLNMGIGYRFGHTKKY